MKKRRKDKYNPYTLIEVKEKNIYIISFKNINSEYLNIEVSKEIYDVFDRSELLDISQMHKVERHIERFELDDISLFNKSIHRETNLEEFIENNLLLEEIKKEIQKLPDIQKRRLIKYFFENKTYEQIALEENCTKMAVKFSVDIAIEKISKKMKN